MMSARYEIILDPSNRYMVWDRLRHTPVEWAGELLIGLNSIHACAALRMLNPQARSYSSLAARGRE